MVPDKRVLRLSLAVMALAIAATAIGLLMPNQYRDNAFVKAAWKGSDQITLLVAVPIMSWAWFMTRSGGRRAYLVLLGMLAYMLYAYAYYLFGAAFSPLFLVHLLLFVLSALALLAGLSTLDTTQLRRCVLPIGSIRAIAVYLTIIALSLTAVYVTQSLQFVMTGTLPRIVELTGHPTSVVFAIDLGLLVPVMMLAAILLWNRRPWGFVLAAMLAVKGPVYTLSLALGTYWAAHAGVSGAMNEIPLWIGLTISGLVVAWWLISGIEQEL